MKILNIKTALTIVCLSASFLLTPNVSFANTEQEDVMNRMEQNNRDFDRRSDEIRHLFDQTIDSYSNGSVANSKLAEKQKNEIERQFNQSKSGLSGNKDLTKDMPSQKRADLTRGLDTNINNTDRDLMRLQNNASNSSLYSDAELDRDDRYSNMSGGAQIDNDDRNNRGNRNRGAATLVMGDTDDGSRNYARDDSSRGRGVGEIVTNEKSDGGFKGSFVDKDFLKYLLVIIVVFVVMAILFFNAKRKKD